MSISERANRLGSNSLRDLVVFGRATSLKAAEIIKPEASHKILSGSAFNQILSRYQVRHASGEITTAKLRLKM